MVKDHSDNETKNTCYFISRSQVPTFTGSSVWDRKKKGERMRGGPPALAGTREYQQSDWNQ